MIGVFYFFEKVMSERFKLEQLIKNIDRLSKSVVMGVVNCCSILLSAGFCAIGILSYFGYVTSGLSITQEFALILQPVVVLFICIEVTSLVVRSKIRDYLNEKKPEHSIVKLVLASPTDIGSGARTAMKEYLNP